MIKLAALVLACLALSGAAACRDDRESGEGGSARTETIFTWPQVEQHLQRELECFGDSDPCRETKESALRGGRNYGSYIPFVFKPGIQPTGLGVAGVSVPRAGEIAWGEFKPYGWESPGRGTYAVIKNYGGNVVLLYYVEAESKTPPTQMPRGFLLLDRALSKLTGAPPTTTVAGIDAP